METLDGIAVIRLNNPPVNSLNHATRTSAFSHLRKAVSDDAVSAIVITGSGEYFSAGADIREFDSLKSSQEPSLRTLIATIERSPKPVIAALQGSAMGGGLELALGCHYRIAAAGIDVSLPEIKLGALPGTGGTQRLPRLVGVERALDMILKGTVAKAEKVHELFNELVPDSLDRHALAFARKVAHLRPLPRVRDIKLSFAHQEPFFQFARASAASAYKGMPAAIKCIDCVQASVALPFDAGLKLERENILALLQTTESKALRHVFFSERAAAKIDNLDRGVKPRDISDIAVIGAGTMGAGIAMTLANAGVLVRIVDTSQEAVAKALRDIRDKYDASLTKKRLSRAEVDLRLARITGSVGIEAARDAEMVIEAVYEDMELKKKVFADLSKTMAQGSILATNTSTLDVDEIAAVTNRPADVIGMHFFSPANVMRLVEVIRGRSTSDEVLATVVRLARKIGKVPVVAGVCDGFIGNRMVHQYTRQAFLLLEEGCTPAQVDRAIEKFGFAMGPFRMGDMSGNDIGWAGRKRRLHQDPAYVHSRIPDLLCEAGRFGQKTGAGWYDYAAGDRRPRPSTVVADMTRAHLASAGITPRPVTDAEIVDRLVLSLVNEGARILEEDIAQRASDIDVVYTTGYGFPRLRGGPMFYANTLGLPEVLDRMERFAEGRNGKLWKPADLLLRLAAEGRPLV
jgi:3-hydroxyacyl-CoA dehydrogenase